MCDQGVKKDIFERVMSDARDDEAEDSFDGDFVFGLDDVESVVHGESGSDGVFFYEGLIGILRGTCNR